MRFPVILQTLGWSLVGVLDLALNRATLPDSSLAWALYAAGLLVGMGASISSLLFLAYRRWLPARGGRVYALVALGTLVGAGAWYVVTNLVDRAVDYPFYEPLADGLWGRAMLFFFILGTWHCAVLALRASERAARAERLAQDARLAALRYQLNPHFLFNTLSSAITLIDEDPPRAQHMLELLASLLRRTLDEQATAETTLEQELDVIRRYLEIQHVRFEDKLAVTLDVPDAARRVAMPPLVLHTLVENAVKHGLETATRLPVEIELRARYDGAALTIEVSNSGHMASTADGERVGLKNVVDRLDTLYPGRHSFAITEKAGAVHATMEIRAPKVLA